MIAVQLQWSGYFSQVKSIVETVITDACPVANKYIKTSSRSQMATAQ